MSATRLTLRARIFIGTVVGMGIVSGGLQIARIDPAGNDWLAIAILGGLGTLAPLFSIRYVGKMPTGVAHQISSSFIYTLMVVSDSGMACLAFLLIAASDQFVFRRNWTNALFNLGNLWLAVGAAALVRQWIAPGSAGSFSIEIKQLGIAAASMITFAVVNHALTLSVVNLINRDTRVIRNWITLAGFYMEAQCLFSGISMAIFWLLHPAMILLIALPIFGISLMLVRLTSREQSHAKSAKELQSLQTLGIELGKELDENRLHEAILRITCQALEAPAAFLMLREDNSGTMRITASCGLKSTPPERLPTPELDFTDEARSTLLLGESDDVPDFLKTLPYESPSTLCATLSIQDRSSGMLVVLHGLRRRPFDEEDRKRLESLMRFINMALSNARGIVDRRELESRMQQSEKLSALGIMVSGVAHELNNPLTSIMGYAELLAAGESDGKRGEMLSHIGDETRRAGKIVQSLLTFSRKHKPERTPVDLNQLCNELVEFRGYELKVRNIEFNLQLSPALPKTHADAHQLQQVLINLINNAEHAIGETGLPGSISIQTLVDREKIILIVSDDGPGMPADVVNRAFLPFFTTKEVGQGTGLGLSICYGIIEEHGGHIDVESLAGKGTTFRISLPIYHGHVSTDKLPEVTRDAPTTAIRGRILVVDDELAILQVLTEFFQSAGWIVVSARNGQDALEAVDTSDFDVLIVDMLMPGMDGRSFYEYLKQLRPDLLSRVIFTTGDTGNQHTTDFLQSLDNQVVRKPYDLGDLHQVIGGVMQMPRNMPNDHDVH